MDGSVLPDKRLYFKNLKFSTRFSFDQGFRTKSYTYTRLWSCYVREIPCDDPENLKTVSEHVQ